jgi:hypothetical protein
LPWTIKKINGEDKGEQPLSPAAGKTLGQPFADYEAYQWCMHSYFNVKRKRAGHLFQGRYKAILVEASETD